MKTEANGHFRRVLEFERFSFYPAERLLESRGKRVSLTPRLIDLLTLLLDNHGELVTKETILQTLWPNSFVEENNINQAVSSLRKKLGDEAHLGEYIETIPKVGFRFIAPVIIGEERIIPVGRRGRRSPFRSSVLVWVLSGLTLGTVIVGSGFLYLGRSKPKVSKNGLVNLTSNLAEDTTPMCSPDGKKIAFASNRDGNSNIYVMNIDGSHVERLTNIRADEGDPSWSPDGSRILFVSNRDGNRDLYVMNSDGSDQTRLTSTLTAEGGPARFSPDGKKIAFARSAAVDGMAYYNFDIYTMNADGSDVRQLTTDPEYDAGPVWSPDGSKIAFLSVREKNYDVFVMNVDGTEQTNLTNTRFPEHEAPVAWTPDGQIIFTGNSPAKTELSQLWVMNTDGSNRRQITNFPDNSYQISSYSQTLGKFALASRVEGNFEIYLLTVDLPKQ